MRLHDFFDYWAREQPEVDFALQGSRHLTYGQTLAAVNSLANALVDAGLEIGDRIAILSRNSIEYLLLYFAASKAGVALVPLNFRLAAPEWTYILNDARPRVLFAAEPYLTAIDDCRTALESVERFIALDEPGAAGWESYQQLAAAQPSTPPSRLISDESVVYQMYTSGTTGHPKGR